MCQIWMDCLLCTSHCGQACSVLTWFWETDFQMKICAQNGWGWLSGTLSERVCKKQGWIEKFSCDVAANKDSADRTQELNNPLQFSWVEATRPGLCTFIGWRPSLGTAVLFSCVKFPEKRLSYDLGAGSNHSTWKKGNLVWRRLWVVHQRTCNTELQRDG